MVVHQKISVTVVCFLMGVYGGGGVTKQSGITKFWADDYKIFDQIYGKTSDKHIYGASLPPSISYRGSTQKKALASEKKERLLDANYNDDYVYNTDMENFADRYAKIFQKQLLDYEQPAQLPQSTLNFVSYSDFKPISQETDPDAYDYLKHVEQYDKVKNVDLPKSTGGFKPFLTYGGNAEETQAYKSIQDILDAHESNKSKTKINDEEEEVNYLNYPRPKNKVKTNPRYIQSNELKKPRCTSGRCRKRTTNYIRRTRPYVRKIKHRIVNY
ncbi:uncharacterized protein LOC131850961 [Achroia grisella]|uniref:uncharacterized protein LOC131850961 n=1 Tax=Achroia grisella TaxID=688607 RepID=UPI0027D2F4C7|nr:uncharacterized protein LOC131850961 [Achroia grisella]